MPRCGRGFSQLSRLDGNVRYVALGVNLVLPPQQHVLGRHEPDRHTLDGLRAAIVSVPGMGENRGAGGKWALVLRSETIRPAGVGRSKEVG